MSRDRQPRGGQFVAIGADPLAADECRALARLAQGFAWRLGEAIGQQPVAGSRRALTRRADRWREIADEFSSWGGEWPIGKLWLSR